MKPSKDVVDITLAPSSVGGDVEFLGEIAGVVEAALPTLLREIQEALTNGDLRAVERKAHLVKRAAEDVSAKTASEAALALEESARGGELNALRRAACKLENELTRLQPALATLGNLTPYAMPPNCAGESC